LIFIFLFFKGGTWQVFAELVNNSLANSCVYFLGQVPCGDISFNAKFVFIEK
jgi:hypothetical protein